MNQALQRSQLPSVDRLLAEPRVQALVVRHGRAIVTRAVRDELAAFRQKLSETSETALREALVAAIGANIAQVTRPALRRVFNLTGTVLHTNLGRAQLPEEAVEALVLAARQATNLEFNLADGRRGDRDA